MVTPEEQILHSLNHHEAAGLARKLVAEGQIGADEALAATEQVCRASSINEALSPSGAVQHFLISVGDARRSPRRRSLPCLPFHH